jgi:hypothetical protein
MMKHGPIIARWRVNGRVWNGNIHNCPARKSSKANHPQFFGTHKPQYWNIITRGTQQQLVLFTMRCLLTG